jgi:hypothetical protein
MSVNPGELYHTVRGIAEIESFYTENGLDKVRFWMHLVNEEDGVTPNGEAVLMSTTPDKLQAWINRFPKDIKERRNAMSALKDRYPEETDRVDGILERIQTAEVNGPTVESKLESDQPVMEKTNAAS